MPSKRTNGFTWTQSKFADAVGEDSGVFHCEEGAFPRNGARIMGRYSATLQIAEFILLSLWDSSVSLCKSIYAGCIIPRVQAHWLRIYYWVAFSYERMTGKHTNVNELFKYFWTWFQNICITLLNCCTRLQGYRCVLSQALDFPDLEAWEPIQPLLQDLQIPLTYMEVRISSNSHNSEWIESF